MRGRRSGGRSGQGHRLERAIERALHDIGRAQRRIDGRARDWLTRLRAALGPEYEIADELEGSRRPE
jgi:hypothetical protein